MKVHFPLLHEFFCSRSSSGVKNVSKSDFFRQFIIESSDFDLGSSRFKVLNRLQKFKNKKVFKLTVTNKRFFQPITPSSKLMKKIISWQVFDKI